MTKHPSLNLESTEAVRTVCGERDQNLLLLEQAFGIEIFARGTLFSFKGKSAACKQASHVIQELHKLACQGLSISSREVRQAIEAMNADPTLVLTDLFLDSIGKTLSGRPITPKTVAQKSYISSLRNFDIVFAWGPAGTGKTYLAMAMAVSALLHKEVNRIVLTRPAVEAGEKLGFLPGDMVEKVNPYLRPLYDALYEMLDMERANQYLTRNQIEVAPLAFMRGRTLNDSFVILDEAQNTTPEQMKMFLTRLGHHSRAVITGDITQVDLPHGSLSGLIHALKLLRSVPGIGFSELTERDVVRHELVRRIIRAYETQRKRRPSS